VEVAIRQSVFASEDLSIRPRGRFRALVPIVNGMAGRPRKSLLTRCDERSFRARDHHRLLGSEPDLPCPQLAELQQRYRQATELSEQRWLAVEFQRRLQGRHRSLPALPSEPLPPLAELVRGLAVEELA